MAGWPPAGGRQLLASDRPASGPAVPRPSRGWSTPPRSGWTWRRSRPRLRPATGDSAAGSFPRGPERARPPRHRLPPGQPHRRPAGERQAGGANLFSCDLTDAVATGADLSRANLDGTVLRRADLRKANLRGASLFATIIEAADLSGANLSGTRIIGYLRGRQAGRRRAHRRQHRRRSRQPVDGRDARHVRERRPLRRGLHRRQSLQGRLLARHPGGRAPGARRSRATPSWCRPT